MEERRVLMLIELFQDIRERLSIFIEMYDYIRIIDPLLKRVLHEDEEISSLNFQSHGRRCYDFWGKDGVCRNCISFRAYQNKRSLFKIERIDDEAYCLFALPIENKGSLYVVELLKKITNEDFFSDLSSSLTIPLDTNTQTLTEMANTDSLTNVYNRRFLEEQLAKELMYCHFYQTDLAVLLIDIDHFKQINDSYGHLVGDEVLKQFVAVIQSSLRQDIDWVSRYGGEEFVVVLKNINSDEAKEVAERIRYQTEKNVFYINEEPSNLTCSIGVSMSNLGQCSQRELLLDADYKLYEAKKNGRNLVVS